MNNNQTQKAKPTIKIIVTGNNELETDYALGIGLSYNFDRKYSILTSRLYVIYTNEAKDIVVGILDDEGNLKTINGTRISLNNEDGTIHAEEVVGLNDYTQSNNLGVIGKERVLRDELRKHERYLKEYHKEQCLVKNKQKVKEIIN